MASLAACGSSYSKLEVDKIQTIAVIVDDPEQRFCAYQPVPLRALVTYKDGKQVRSHIPGEHTKGLVRTTEFEWSSNHGAVDPQAVLALPHGSFGWVDQPISVRARVIAKPVLQGENTLRPRFDCGGTLDLRGAEGARGGEAEPGGPGAAGPEVQVALAYVDTRRSGRLVLVRVQRGDEPVEHYIIDPRNPRAPFVIDARGGAGGGGGQGIMGTSGIDGVAGAAGIDGSECGDGTPGQPGTPGTAGGPGGPGANGGPGGVGGRVLVQYDARFPELATHVQVRVDGGEAGAAGPGGPGGRGGKGGLGGKGGQGSSTSSSGVTPCAGVAGTDGTAGADGAAGSTGPAGQPGTAAAPGERRDAPVEVSQLFAAEISRGIPVVTGAGGQ